MTATREPLDAVVLGAGFAGLAMLHRLRELGLRAVAFDAADDVGGSWWWHGYPGSRLDTEAPVYQYFFSRRLYDEWGWSERYPAGYEVLRWLRFVADRLDLRRDIRLSTRVVAARLDEDRGRWTVRTDRGETVESRFVVSCAGVLPGAVEAGVDGEGFAGTVLHTSSWPEKGPDVTGARVGVVGSGVPTVQLLPTIVDRVAHLTVFARTPTDVRPRTNPVYGWREREAYRARFDEVGATLPYTADGAEPDDEPEPEIDGVRAAMRARLGDPRLVDVLVPADGSDPPRRVPRETGYLEVYHRPHVELVDLRADPIARLRPEGVELAGGAVHELDVLVLAPAFDAGAPALTRVDVRGRDGRSLARDWDADPRTTLGLAKHGYPNLFLTAAPLAPDASRATMSTVLQAQTEWIAGAVRDLLAAGGSTIEPTRAGEDAWVAHHGEVSGSTSQPYAGGVGRYRRMCDDEAAAGYPSFTWRLRHT